MNLEGLNSLLLLVFLCLMAFALVVALLRLAPKKKRPPGPIQIVPLFLLLWIREWINSKKLDIDSLDYIRRKLINPQPPNPRKHIPNHQIDRSKNNDFPDDAPPQEKKTRQ